MRDVLNVKNIYVKWKRLKEVQMTDWVVNVSNLLNTLEAIRSQNG